jgi:hypothetical protein
MKESNESKLSPLLGVFFALTVVLALIMLEYLGHFDFFHPPPRLVQKRGGPQGR